MIITHTHTSIYISFKRSKKSTEEDRLKFENRWKKKNRMARRERLEASSKTSDAIEVDDYFSDSEESVVLDDKNDPEWVPEKKEKDSSNKNKKKKKRRKTTIKKYAFKKVGVGYTNFDDDSSSESEDSDDGNARYQFAIDLQKMDTNPSFHNQVVVAMKVTREVRFISWTELKRLLKSSKKQYVIEIRIIPRCRRGQVYIFDGFREFVHFSIGPIAWQEMKYIFSLPKYKYQFESSNVLIDSNMHPKKHNNKAEHIIRLATDVGRSWLKHLLSTKRSKKRVPCNISMGFTDLK